MTDKLNAAEQFESSKDKGINVPGDESIGTGLGRDYLEDSDLEELSFPFGYRGKVVDRHGGTTTDKTKTTNSQDQESEEEDEELDELDRRAKEAKKVAAKGKGKKDKQQTSG